MPKIHLKPNSAEYADPKDSQPRQSFGCEMPGCREAADFKAPKDRSLTEYYRFCLTHVQEYNQAWNYFSGMAQSDIEDHIVSSTLGDRPTWRYDNFANLENELKSRVWQYYHFSDRQPPNGAAPESPFTRNSPEYEAMIIMELEPPLTLQGIKARYKELAKKHHPDVNRDNPQSEELLKRINMAYTILKLAYEKYDKLEKL